VSDGAAHGAHVRGAMRGVATPPIYGLTSEDVRALSLVP
jgi:hypothetical protein